MKFLAKYESNSEPGTYHKLFWNNGYYCTCPGFKWNKKKRNWCRHCEEWEKDNGTPVTKIDLSLGIDLDILQMEAMATVYNLTIPEAWHMIAVDRATAETIRDLGYTNMLETPVGIIDLE